MSIRKQAAEFYLAAAKGTSMEKIITSEAADRLGRVFEICHNSRKRRQANKEAEQKQPVSKLNKQEILTLAYAAVALFASGFLN